MTTTPPVSARSPKSSDIWIDLDNTPHVPFFAPIIAELERRGYRVTVTARDAYQVWELADLFQLKYRRIGRHYGRMRILKIIGTCFRSLQLMTLPGVRRAGLAVNHGSRSMILAAGVLQIPSLTIIDYEHAGPTLGFKPTWVLVPEVVMKSSMQPRRRRLLHYPGIKEDVYVPSFKPDRTIRARLGLGSGDIVVLVRPPATEAHYHVTASDDLFDATMSHLSTIDDVRIVLLPRNTRQADALRASWPELFAAGKARTPDAAEDGLNLIWNADLVVSGGGTMNREAAALGVPVYSIFRGQIGAVDRYLAESHRLTLLESADEVRAQIRPARRVISLDGPGGESPTLTAIVDHIVRLAESRTLPYIEQS